MESDPCNGRRDTYHEMNNVQSSVLSRRVQGVILLLVVVVLWTLGNFITQDLFKDGYEKPFLVTYLNTSSFALYLLPWLLRTFVLRTAEHENNRRGYEAVASVETLEAPTSTLISSFRSPSTNSEEIRPPETLDPLTTEETARLASIFCLFWFIANWSVNASLQFTSVASATVLSSTSGFFTLLVGRVFKVETLTVAKILGVVSSFIGVVLVSLSDSASNTHEGPVDGRSMRVSSVLGDGLALLSAAFYALYVILLKVKIKEENRIDMQLFFGFVGLFNVLLLWPIGIILHITGVETLASPPSRSAWIAVLINMCITLLSDYIYVLAMLKTTPLLVTVGLSLTIPLAIFGDYILAKPAAFQALFGALLVLGAFVLVGMDKSRNVSQDKEQEEDIEINIRRVTNV